MAVIYDDLKASVVNNWVMSGKDKAAIESIIAPAINDGVGMFWRERPWSFSLRTDTFTLTVNTTTGYSCPTDCDGIVRMKRENNQIPFDMVEFPPHLFDEQFPYPNAHPTDSSSYYKVEVDNGTMKIFVMPISGTADTVRRTYKMKYNLNTALALIPADFKYALTAASLYMSVPSVIPDGVRMAAFQEYQELLKKAVNLDKTSYRKLTKIGQANVELINPNSWQYYLGDNRWNE